MEKVFDKYEKWGAYHWIWGTRKNHWYNKMITLSLKEFPNEGSILDIGCGDGYVCARLKEKGLYVEGFDNNLSAVYLANQILKGVKIYHSDIKDIRLEKNFDYFYAQNVIEHFKDSKPLVDLFEKHCNKFMILATDIPVKRLGKFEYSYYSFEDLVKLFKDYKVEKLYEFRKVYVVKLSK